jgi:hypothetical protein
MEGMTYLQSHLFHKEVEFGNIEGYDDIKESRFFCKYAGSNPEFQHLC